MKRIQDHSVTQITLLVKWRIKLKESHSFFDRPNVKIETIQVAGGIRFGFERVFNSALGVGGVYGAWGESYDNDTIRPLVESRYGGPLKDEDFMNLDELGFLSRHHIPFFISLLGNQSSKFIFCSNCKCFHCRRHYFLISFITTYKSQYISLV